MSVYTLNTRQAVLGKNLIARVRQELDEYADLSFYGKYIHDSAFDGNAVDRKRGILYGEYHTLDESYPTEEAAQDAANRYEDLGYAVEWEWSPTTIHITGTTSDGSPVEWTREYGEDDWWEYDDDMHELRFNPQGRDWTITRKEWRLSVSGYEVLATGLSSTYDRNSYRYWEPADNYRGIEREEWVKYVLQDYERMEDYNRNDWCMTDIIVEVLYKGVEIGSSSLGGVESDADDGDPEKGHYWEIVGDCLHEALREAPKFFDDVGLPAGWEDNMQYDRVLAKLKEADEVDGYYRKTWSMSDEERAIYNGEVLA